MSLDDADAVAQLHAASWRVAYRHVLSESYLATAIDADRRDVWASRLRSADENAFGLMVDADSHSAAFAYVSRPSDPSYGNLLENIHVSARVTRHGVGRHLFVAVCQEIIRRDWSCALHLWVYDTNTGARRFYDALGGVRVGDGLRDAPDGQRIPAGRYYWSDIRVLLKAD